MSKIDQKRNLKKMKLGNWVQMVLIKVRVSIILCFFKETRIERKCVDYELINELYTWSIQKGIKFSIEEKEKNIYIRGRHYVHKIDSTRHLKVLFFSK